MSVPLSTAIPFYFFYYNLMYFLRLHLEVGLLLETHTFSIFLTMAIGQAVALYTLFFLTLPVPEKPLPSI